MAYSALLAAVASHASIGALERFLHAVEPSAARRAVHIEVGANNGAFTASAFKRLCFRPAMASVTRPLDERHLFVLVEPQPQFRDHLEHVASSLSGNSSACRVVFLGSAAWIADGQISFVLSRDSRGAGVADSVRVYGKRTQPKTVVVPSVDFAAYLLRTLRPADLVFAKVDVETGRRRARVTLTRCLTRCRTPLNNTE